MEDGVDGVLILKNYMNFRSLMYRISETMFGILHKEWEGKFKEIDKDQAEWGSCLFSELRDVAKVWEQIFSGYEDRHQLKSL